MKLKNKKTKTTYVIKIHKSESKILIDEMKNTLGLLLCGGTGSRLFPATYGVNKHLLAIYNKPMFHYGISNLVLAGLSDIKIVVNPWDRDLYQKYLDHIDLPGVAISLLEQKKPAGIADALASVVKLYPKKAVLLHLGDNLFLGENWTYKLKSVFEDPTTPCLFLKSVTDPKPFGVVQLDEKNERVIDIVEKPENPKSNLIATGLYYFPNDIGRYVENLKRSERGEFEITEVIQRYLGDRMIRHVILGRGFSWMDCGSFEKLNSASNLIKLINDTSQQDVADLLELKNNWSDKNIQ